MPLKNAFSTLSTVLKPVREGTVGKYLSSHPSLPRRAEKLLTVLQVTPQRCGTCANFNLQAGQDQMRMDQKAQHIMGALTPAQMAASEAGKYTEEGKLDESIESSLRPGKIATWAGQFGACSHFKELVHEDLKVRDKATKELCPHWSPF